LPDTKTKGAANASPRALAVLTALAARLGIDPAPLAAAGQDPVATPGDPQPGAGSDGPAPAKDDKPGKTEAAPVIDASAAPVDPTLTLTAQPTIAPAAIAAVPAATPADPTTTLAPSGAAPINAIADAADSKTAAPPLAPATLAAVAGPAGVGDAPTDAHAPTDGATVPTDIAAAPVDAAAPAIAPAVPQGPGMTVSSEDKAKAAPSASPASSPPTTPSLNASVAHADADAPANTAAAIRPEPGDAPAHGHVESAPDIVRPPAITGGSIQASADIQPSLNPIAPAAAQPFSAVLALTPQHPAASDRAVPLAGVAVEIAARVEDGQKRFEIRLDPPELGRIEVRLDVDAAGRVATHLMADRADTLDLLRRDAPALERALQSAGLKTDDGTLQFSLRDQSFAGRDPGFARIAPPAQLIVPDADGAPLDAALRRYGQLMGLGSGVDIRV